MAIVVTAALAFLLVVMIAPSFGIRCACVPSAVSVLLRVRRCNAVMVSCLRAPTILLIGNENSRREEPPKPQARLAEESCGVCSKVKSVV